MMNSLFDVLQGNKLKNALIIKETSSMDQSIKLMKEALQEKSGFDIERLERDLKYLEVGNYGEQQILYELKNSQIPMIVIRDLCLVYEDNKAQIDFLIITGSSYYLLECKNLYGNIEINSRGDFIRTVFENGNYKKEGMYSPITQNQRHLNVLKEMRIADMTNPIQKLLFTKGFESIHVPLVVLTNAKTVVNMRYAKKEVKEQVIRVDQLVEFIRKREKTIERCFNDEDLNKLGQYFLSKHQNNNIDILGKYKIEIEETIDENHPMYQALKQYRLIKCREENIKAYYIFNNKQLEQIIRIEPKSIEDLKQVNGFGLKQIEKYGKDIIEIVNKR